MYKKLPPLPYLKASCQSNTPSSPNTLVVDMSCKQGHSPLPEYNQEIITETSLPLALGTHSSFAKCPCLCSKMTPFRIMHSIGCHVFLVSFRLKQVLRLVLAFMTFTLLKITANCFAECPSIWVGLFPQGYTLGRNTLEVMRSWHSLSGGL